MDAMIYDFAASIELDDEGVAMGVDDGIDGVAARGDDSVGDGNVSAGNVGVGNVGVGGGERVTKKRKGKMLLSDADLLHYYETKLGSVIGCSCQGNCLRILEDEVICSAVASYLVWLERRSKYEQDNIILQWVIYGQAPGGRHSLSTSHHRRREHGYHVPFDGSLFDDDGESLERIRFHHFCSLGLQFVMGIGKFRMNTIQQIAKTTSMMPLSRRHGKPSHSEMKVDDIIKLIRI
jgi:hypothetical protein